MSVADAGSTLMHRPADPTLDRLDRWTRWLAILGFLGLCVIAILTTWDGLARYMMWPRLSGYADFVDVVLAVAISTCFPAGLLHRNNITIRFVGSLLGGRKAGLIEAFGATVTLAFFSLLAWQVWAFVMQLKSSGRTSATIEMAIWPWWWTTATLLALTVPIQCFVVWRSWCETWGGRGLPPADD